MQVPRSIGIRFRPFAIGAVLLTGAAYYYVNYVKPAVVVQPASIIKQDAKNLLDASNKLAVDLKKEGQNIIQSSAKAAENLKK